MEGEEPCHDRYIDDMDNVCEMPREYTSLCKLQQEIISDPELL